MPYCLDKLINVRVLDKNGNVLAEVEGVEGLPYYESNCDEENDYRQFSPQKHTTT